MQKTERMLFALGVAALCGFVFFFSFRKIYAPDYFWHAETGGYILKNGIPKADMFSFTAEGEKLIDLSWLAQIIIHLLGDTGTIVLRSLVFVSAFILSLFLFPLKKAFLRLILCALLMLSVVTASPRYLCRPTMFTDLLFVVFVFLLIRLRGWRLLLLLPLTVIWVNLHNGFIMAPILLITTALSVLLTRLIGGEKDVEQRLHYLLALLGAVVVASSVNPYFIDGALYPLKFFGKPLGYTSVMEWQSPIRKLTDILSTDLLSYKLLLLAVVGSTIVSYRNWSPFRLALTGLTVLLSLIAYRNVSLFALVAPPITAANLENTFEAKLPQKLQKVSGYTAVGITVMVSVVMSVLCVTNEFWRSRRLYDISFGTGISEVTFPKELPAFLSKKTEVKRTFHNYEMGGFLIARCGRKSFLDGRLVHFPKRIHNDYWKVMKEPLRLESLVHRYKIDSVLLEHHRGRFDPLIKYLYNSRRWELMYLDTVVVMFKRCREVVVRNRNTEMINDFVKRFLSGEYTYSRYPEYDRESLLRLLRLLEENSAAMPLIEKR